MTATEWMMLHLKFSVCKSIGSRDISLYAANKADTIFIDTHSTGIVRHSMNLHRFRKDITMKKLELGKNIVIDIDAG